MLLKLKQLHFGCWKLGTAPIIFDL